MGKWADQAALISAEQRRLLREAAEGAIEALDAVINDPKVLTHALTQSQFSGLAASREALDQALP